MKKKWVKLVLASSIDGRIAYPEGGKTQLGQSGDRLVLEESLAWSDGILMGGQTLRDHQSICVIKNKSLLKKKNFRRQERTANYSYSKQSNRFSRKLAFF